MKMGIVVLSELLFGEALVRVVVFSSFMVHHLLHGHLIAWVYLGYICIPTKIPLIVYSGINIYHLVGI